MISYSVEVHYLSASPVLCQSVLKRWHCSISTQKTLGCWTSLLAWEAAIIWQNSVCNKMVRQTVVLLINHTEQDCQGVLNVCSFFLFKDKLYYIDHSGWVSVSCQSGPNVSMFVHLHLQMFLLLQVLFCNSQHISTVSKWRISSPVNFYSTAFCS